MQIQGCQLGDKDEELDLGLDKWNVDIENIKKPLMFHITSSSLGLRCGKTLWRMGL